MACGGRRAENVFPKKSRFRQNLAENLVVIKIAELIPHIYQAVSRFPGPMFEHACCHLGPPVAPPRLPRLYYHAGGLTPDMRTYERRSLREIEASREEVK
jgi:hypothetical protein